MQSPRVTGVAAPPLDDATEPGRVASWEVRGDRLRMSGNP